MSELGARTLKKCSYKEAKFNVCIRIYIFSPKQTILLYIASRWSHIAIFVLVSHFTRLISALDYVQMASMR